MSSASYLKAATEAECPCPKQDQLVQFCTQTNNHFSLLLPPPSLSLSLNSPPREPIKAKDDGDDDGEGGGGGCMSTARENSCTGTQERTQQAKDQPNPVQLQKSPITDHQSIGGHRFYALSLSLSPHIIIAQSIAHQVFQRCSFRNNGGKGGREEKGSRSVGLEDENEMERRNFSGQLVVTHFLSL